MSDADRRLGVLRRVRARWLLFALVLATLTLLLTVEGYRTHEIGVTGTRAAGAEDPQPSPVRGPLVTGDRASTSDLASRSTPPRTVVLTFDDGPDPRWTPAVLDVLHRHRVPGTFFVVGTRAYEHPDLLRREQAEGHEIGLHTFTHQDLSLLPTWRRRLEIDLDQQAVVSATGSTTRLVRPPYSSTPDAVDAPTASALRWLSGRGYLPTLSDLDSRDWERPGVDEVRAAATPRGGSGAVLLMHDGGGDRAQTVAALDALIPQLQAQGYRFATVADAFGAGAVEQPAPLGVRLRSRCLGVAMALSHAVAVGLVWMLALLGLLSIGRAALVVRYARRHVRRTRTAGSASAHSSSARSNSARITHGTEPPLVTVVVPAYNEAAGIVAAVRSLCTTDHPRLEVVVVDDGSTDGTGDLVEALDLPNVRLLRQENAGKPAALNTGIAAAAGDILVLVDGDTVFEPATIGRYRWCYGTLQAMWKHRWSVDDAAAGRRLGRIGLPYMLLFQVLLPLLAPVVDVYALYGLVFLDPVRVLGVWCAFVVLQAALAGYALRLDGESWRDLWAVPLQQFVYRQLMYLVVVESVVTALTGARLRWHKLHRTGIGRAVASSP